MAMAMAVFGPPEVSQKSAWRLGGGDSSTSQGWRRDDVLGMLTLWYLGLSMQQHDISRLVIGFYFEVGNEQTSCSQ